MASAQTYPAPRSGWQGAGSILAAPPMPQWSPPRRSWHIEQIPGLDRPYGSWGTTRRTGGRGPAAERDPTIPALPVTGTWIVGGNVAKLRNFHRSIPLRAISQRDAELLHASCR